MCCCCCCYASSFFYTSSFFCFLLSWQQFWKCSSCTDANKKSTTWSDQKTTPFFLVFRRDSAIKGKEGRKPLQTVGSRPDSKKDRQAGKGEGRRDSQAGWVHLYPVVWLLAFCSILSQQKLADFFLGEGEKKKHAHVLLALFVSFKHFDDTSGSHSLGSTMGRWGGGAWFNGSVAVRNWSMRLSVDLWTTPNKALSLLGKLSVP